MRYFVENIYHRTSVMLWVMLGIGLISAPVSTPSDNLLNRLLGLAIVVIVWYWLYGLVSWVFGLRRLVARTE